MSCARHIFGPVPSRRLGRSLGVDLVPFKTCTYDCIYCQLGRTTCKTVERREWVSMDAVLNELKQKLASRPDYITLSGSGEPTLHSRLGEIIEHIQAMTDVPVAVLTNGSLLWQKEVREEVSLADVVMPSLDAGDELLFQAVNRPHPAVTFEKLVSGLEQFRCEFTGQYCLEVLLLAGHTAPPAHVQKIAEWVRRIQPDRVQLNTAIRPPAEEFAVPVSRARLSELARLFSPKAEVIAEYRRQGKRVTTDANQQAILELLLRRPCTEADVAGGAGHEAHRSGEAPGGLGETGQGAKRAAWLGAVLPCGNFNPRHAVLPEQTRPKSTLPIVVMKSPSSNAGLDPQPRNEAAKNPSFLHRLSLVLYPDPVLRTVCQPVETFDSALRDLAEEMLSLMRYHSGIGLATPQVGLRQRLIVSSIENRPFALTNLEVKDSTEPRDFVEGCLSLPGIQVKVRRPERIQVSGYDLHGQRRSFGAVGLWARVIQHELDHLNGVLICDYSHPQAEECSQCPLELPTVLIEERKHRSRPNGRR